LRGNDIQLRKSALGQKQTLGFIGLIPFKNMVFEVASVAFLVTSASME